MKEMKKSRKKFWRLTKKVVKKWYICEVCLVEMEDTRWMWKGLIAAGNRVGTDVVIRQRNVGITEKE